jgi:hypothetical protein
MYLLVFIKQNLISKCLHIKPSPSLHTPPSTPTPWPISSCCMCFSLLITCWNSHDYWRIVNNVIIISHVIFLLKISLISSWPPSAGLLAPFCWPFLLAPFCWPPSAGPLLLAPFCWPPLLVPIYWLPSFGLSLLPFHLWWFWFVIFFYLTASVGPLWLVPLYCCTSFGPFCRSSSVGPFLLAFSVGQF